MTWVLSRTHVLIRRYPAWGETLSVLTWPSGRHGFFALRDFEASDASGRPVLTATTSWMILDLGRKQPLKVDGILPMDFLVARRALPDDFASLPVLDGPDRELAFRVDSGHLDLNRHVNNAVYVQWALEAAPPSLAGRRPAEIEVSYRGEAFYGDTVLARAKVVPAADAAQGGEEAGSAVLHQIVNASSGAELTRLRTRWA
jgi:medium-chain acyl-[acyl-carrier-protein] hydrolase